MLLDEIEDHLCKSSYQHQESLHCGYDVHAQHMQLLATPSRNTSVTCDKGDYIIAMTMTIQPMTIRVLTVLVYIYS